MKKSAFVCLLLFAVFSAFAQQPTDTYGGYLVKQTPPLRDLQNMDESNLIPVYEPSGKRIWPQGFLEPEDEEEEGIMTSPPAPDGYVDPIVQKKSPQANPNAENIGIISGFEGLTASCYPLDPSICVGPNYVIQVTNNVPSSKMKIFNKDGTVALNEIIIQNITGFPGYGDVVALYDQLRDRYIVTEFIIKGSNNATENGLAIMVSQTGDPTGAWNVYKWVVAENYLVDYPKWAVWTDGIYVHTNNFSGSYVSSFFAVFNKDDMYAGNPTFRSIRVTQNIGNGYATCPAQLEGNVIPSGGQLFVTHNTTNQATIISCTTNWATSTLTQATAATINLAPFSGDVCSASREACAPQPGGVNVEISTDRVMNQPIYRVLPDYSGMVFCFTVNAGSNKAGIRWVELKNTGAGWSLNQEGTWSPNSNFQFLPSMAYDKNGNIGLAYSTSSSSTYLGIRYTGRKACDPLGQMTLPEGILKDGTGVCTVARWGDYNHMVADPDGNSLWMVSMYGKAGGPGGKSTFISRFDLETCPSGTCNPPSTLTTSNVTTTGATLSFTAPGGASTYNIDYKLATSGTWTNAATNTTATSITLSGLTIGSLYDFRVNANCATSSSVYASAQFTTASSTCGTVSGLTSTSITGSSATISWTAVSGASNYTVDYKVNTASAWTTFAAATTAVTANLTGLALNTLYDWRVRANCSGGNGAYSQAQFTTAATLTNLFNYGASWKFLDNGSDQGTAWRGTSFSDASWASGNGQLGYGDGDEATVVSYGNNANNKYVTTYFRKTISVDNPAAYSVLNANVKRDDGVVVYVNGTEVYRNNMGTGSVLYTTLASLASDDGVTPQPFTIAPSAFVAGNNVIAVEIHQNAASSSDLSFDMELIGTLAPVSCGAVAGLTASAITTAAATISWTAVSGANNYDVDYKNNATSTWTNLATATTVLSVNLSGLLASTLYDWRVRANCTGATGAYTTAQFTTSAPPTCGIVTGLTASALTTTGATVSWSTLSGANNYDVDYKVSTASAWTNAITATTGTSVAISGLTASTLYDWRVRANCTGASGVYSSAQFNTAVSGTCGAVAGLAGTGITTTGITLNWTLIPAAISYDVDYKTAVSPLWVNLASGTTASAVSLSGLSSSTLYDWRVRANCTDGAAAYATAQFTTATPATCGTVTGLSSTSITTTGATISWTALAGANLYDIDYKINTASVWTNAGTAVTATSLGLSGLSANTLYDWRVRANCTGATGIYTTAQFTTTATAGSCGTVTGLSATAITTAGATLSWTALSGANNYDVDFKISAGSTWTSAATATTAITVNIAGLAAGSLYDWRVRANCTNASGNYAVAQFATTTSNQAPDFSYGANWKYLDKGTNQGTAWREVSFNDAAWASGNGELGYGDYDETTVVSYGSNANNKYVTTYFRKTINIANPAAFSTYTASIKRDDGIIVYLNGTEVYRNNMGTGNVTYTTLASLASDDGLTVYTFTIPPGNFITGNNVIAVEIHQTDVSSSDISFDMKLVSTQAPGTCGVLGGLTSNAVTTSSATLSWTALNGALNYDVDYKLNASPTWVNAATATTAISINLSGLSSSTLYDWRVRANCTGAVGEYASTQFTTATPNPTPDFSYGANWKYLDNGNDQGSTWTGVSFNDAAWASGNGQLGYGDYDETTVVSYGNNANNKYITTYFRKMVNFNDPSGFSTLTAHVKRDDGIIVYVNGAEVFRNNMPTGSVNYNTLADLAYDDGTTPETFTISPGAFVAGANVIAVEIHQTEVTSTDISFDMELVSTPNTGTCGTVTGLNASAITSTNATVSWASIGGAQSYDVDYKKNSASTWTNAATATASTTLDFNGLSGGALYDWRVRANCIGSQGAYASAQFTTTLGSASPDFDYGSSWKYLDNGSNQGTAWTSGAFNDAGWGSGNGELGYGDYDETTVLSYGFDSYNKYITTYFRKTINLLSPSNYSSFTAQVKRDDGIIVYVNGTEVFRDNLPAGTVSYTTLASLAYDDGLTPLTFTIPPSVFVAGNNVIGVEIHQTELTSTDISFDMALASTPVLGPCGTVTGLTAAGITTTSASISWSALSGAYNYDVDYKVSSASVWTNAATASALNYVNLTGLATNTIYDWRVRANCAAGMGAYSNTQFTTASAATCGAVAGLAVSAVTTNSATVAWSALSGALNYDVAYKTSASASWTTAALATTALSVNLSGLSASTLYDWRVRANCSGVSGAYTSTQFTTAAVTTCGAVSGLTNSPIGTTTATITWAALSGALSYDVDYKVNTASTWTNAATATTAVTKNLTGLTSNTLYDWRVRANCSSASGAYTSAQFTTTASATCGTVTTLVSASITASGASLSWAALSGANNYDVDYKVSTSSTWVNAATATTTLSVNLSGLSASSLYDWRVRANCTSGAGAYATAQFTTAGVSTALLTRGPYLNKALQTGVVIRWRTDVATNSKVNYGASPGSLNFSATDNTATTEHIVTLTGLTANTLYYYNIGSTSQVLQGDASNYFKTMPVVGSTQKIRFLAMGDMGNNSTNEVNVRNAWLTFNGSNYTDGWLLLGDNAYDAGLDAEYQSNFYNIYQGNMTKNHVLWPAVGNHDYANSTARQSDHNIPYFNMFTLPSNGEAGGVVSGTEAYYAYNYGNVHFVSLDSYGWETGSTRLYDTLGPQAVWLKQDLAANTQPWTIVYFHHPPYTKGSHDSDAESELINMRQKIVPILERYHVDLVLSGHSHSYERSYLINGHYGSESAFSLTNHALSSSSAKYDGTANSCTYIKNPGDQRNGIVYAVVGSAGQLGGSSAGYPHNAMYYSNVTNGGALYFEVENNRLSAKWVGADGVIRDNFNIMKDVNKTSNITIVSGVSTALSASWIGSYSWSTGATTGSITVSPSVSTTYTVSDAQGCITDVFNVTVIQPFQGTGTETSLGKTSGMLSPNPVSSILTVNIFGLSTAANIRILDLNGRQVLQMKSNDYEIPIDVSHLSSGLYIIAINDLNGKSIFRSKFVKE